MISVMPPAESRSGPDGVTFDEAVERVPFLRALSARDRERLRPYAECRRVQQGQPVWTLDENTREYSFLVEGRVKLMRPCENGREVILDMCGPGDLLCASAVSSFAPYCCSCVALDDDVTVVSIARRDLMLLLEQSASAPTAFVREVTARELRLGRRIEELASGQVDQRIGTLLLRLAEQLGKPGERDEIRIPVHLSRQDLADLCGTTLESAIRTMTRFARENIVRTLPQGFVITDRSGLEQLVRGGAGR